MTVGAGLLEGTDVVDLISINPDSLAYVDHSGVTYHPQDENGNGNIEYYEINNQGNYIDFDVGRYTRDYNRPAIVFRTIYGAVDFDVYDRGQDRTIVSENSDFHSDVWIVDISDASSELRLTDFDDTQAGFYAHISVLDKVV
jgi:hypothetical protein